MAKKTVLRAFVANKSQVSSCFIQKVTDKIICVIKDEKGTDYHRLSDGTRRTTEKGITQVVDSDAVKAFLTENSLTTWDGGWKPDFNSRGEQVSKKLGSLSEHLANGGTHASWLEKAGFTIQDLPMSESIKALLAAPSVHTEGAATAAEGTDSIEVPANESETEFNMTETSEVDAEPQAEVADPAPETESSPTKSKAKKTSKTGTKKTAKSKAPKQAVTESSTTEGAVTEGAEFDDDFTD